MTAITQGPITRPTGRAQRTKLWPTRFLRHSALACLGRRPRR